MTEPLPELVTKVTADVDDAVAAFAEVTAAEKAMGDQSDKTSDKVKKNSKDNASATQEFERLYKASMKDGESATTSFSRAIDDQKKKVKDLQAQFKSGAGSTTAFGDLRQAQSDLSKIEKIYKDIGGESKKIQANTGSFSEIFTGALEIWPQLAGAAAPFLAPVAAGSLLGLLGVGALGAGIAANISDPAVKGAIGKLKTDLSGSVHDATAAFVPDIVAGVGILDKGVSKFVGDLKPGFDALAPEVKTLTSDIAGALDKSGPMWANALKESVPVVSAIGQGLGTLVDDGGRFFDALTIGTKGEADAIGDLSTEVGGLVVSLGQSLGLVSNLYGTISSAQSDANKGVSDVVGKSGFGAEVWSDIKQQAEETINPVKKVQDLISGISSLFGDDATQTAKATVATKAADTAFAGFTTTTDDTTAALNELISTTNTWIGIAQSNDDSLLAMDEAQTTFNKELKTGTKNWDENTAAGQKQVGNLNALNEKITAHYDGLAKLKPLTEAQTLAEYNATSQLLAQAKAAGATTAETQTLTGEVKALKDQLALIKSKKIQITEEIAYNEHFTATYSAGAIRPGTRAIASAGANSGVMSYANSGVPSFANSGDITGVYPGLTQPAYRFAEKSTVAEAVIAKNGDGNRAISTLQTAAAWHDKDIVDRNTRPQAGGDVYITNVVTLNGKELSRQLIGPVQRANSRSSASIYGVQ